MPKLGAIEQLIEMRKEQLNQIVPGEVMVELVVFNEEVKFRVALTAAQAREIVQREIETLERIIRPIGG
jgi:hypothetical protein